ncbi:MAG TPA: hypothetical protein VN317_00100 [Candidatus Methanoperedens sp.]|nr:hypothetical protein [Candidatus Methanoperedens sp.]
MTADALLDWHWLGRLSLGLGAGYWSGDGGQMDIIGNAGYLVSGQPAGRNTELFFEARLPADDLGDWDTLGRYGRGVRFRLQAPEGK